MTEQRFADGLGELYIPIPWDGCWVWMHRLTDGYGQTRINGVISRAHRVMYSLTNGPIPEGMQVLHSCDNRACVNPLHLWLGTNADNMHDKYLKNRQTKGETHGMHVLTENNVRQIRELIKQGESQRHIASWFGVDQSNVYQINTGKTWVWLDNRAALKPDTDEVKM